MAYEIFKKVVSQEEYFNSWGDESLKELTDKLKDQIYKKYLVKCEVFVRDNFTCQNENCPFCGNKKFLAYPSDTLTISPSRPNDATSLRRMSFIAREDYTIP